MTSKADIHGYCDQSFSAVKDVFAENFESGLDDSKNFFQYANHTRLFGQSMASR